MNKQKTVILVLIILLFVVMINVNALIIGGREGGYFKGSIDELRIYNRALTEEEARQHYYSNLYKYDVDEWGFYTNQIDLADGVYTYQGFAKDVIGNENHTERRVIAVNSIIPVNTSCATYYGFDYLYGSWITYLNSSDTVIDIIQCPDDLCVVYPDVSTTCDGAGGIINRDCSDSVPYNKAEGEPCGWRTGLRCSGTGPGSDLIKQENISKCDKDGGCIENAVVGVWVVEKDCESFEYCYYDGVNSDCKCDDGDGDDVCDLLEPEVCRGQNSSNVPADTSCQDWEFNPTTGCWDVTYIGVCADDPDTSKERCAANFEKDIDEIVCDGFGDYNCWNGNVAIADPDVDTACCGDDELDECWVDYTSGTGCCWSNKYSKVVYTIEPDDSGAFCNDIGLKKFGVNPGECNETGEQYCFATTLPEISQDPDCCCCGDDEGETWSVFSSGKHLGEVIVSGKCKKGKWVERKAVKSTLYDIWTYITS